MTPGELSPKLAIWRDQARPPDNSLTLFCDCASGGCLVSIVVVLITYHDGVVIAAEPRFVS